MIHQPDDVETVGNDTRIRKVFSYQGTVHNRQIHAHHLHQMLAFEAVQIAFQRYLAAPQHDIMHLVIPEITKRRCVAMAPAEEVLIDAEHLRTHRTGSLCRHAAQIVPEPALYGGAGDPFPLRQTAAADAVKVLLADTAAKRLTGAQPRQNPRE